MLRNWLGVGLALTTALLMAAGASAQNTKIIESGETTVVLNSGFLQALQGLGVTPGVVAPTQLNATTVNFPINGGAIDLDTAAANVGHTGGLTLTAGGTVVAIENFTIDTTGKTPVITGLVVANGTLVGRITLFDLTLPKGFSTPLYEFRSVFIDLSGVGVSLDSAAATALDGAFNTTAIKPGLAVGIARVRAFTNGWIPGM